MQQPAAPAQSVGSVAAVNSLAAAAAAVASAAGMPATQVAPSSSSPTAPGHGDNQEQAHVQGHERPGEARRASRQGGEGHIASHAGGSGGLAQPIAPGTLGCIEPSFFEVLDVKSVGHRLLFAKGLLALG
mmetsp:Transcript_70972/g.211617  ORF Transcript_70972/g.211617 Transcript_70972/m.211617 type:complete len:130 (+) Transcript_70972:117-506(+)